MNKSSRNHLTNRSKISKYIYFLKFTQAFENNLQRQKAAKQWLSRSSELLDLSSGDSRDTPGAGFDENNQQSGSNNQGLIPQIVMNPWGSEAPMMTFAVQAYQHQWLLQVGLILQEISLINQRILARSSYTYSEKATIFFEIFTLLLTGTT